MHWRSEAAPRALKAQAAAAYAAADAALAYFAGPSAPLADKAMAARKMAGKARLAFDQAVEQEPAPRSDWLEISAALAECAEEAARAAEEAQLFEAELGLTARRAAAALEQAAKSLGEAIGGLGGSRCAHMLVEAKNKALQIENIRRRGRDEALENPRLAGELKTRAVLDHFSRGAEAVQRAADALASRLGEAA